MTLVLGGGIGGLSSAYYLTKGGSKVTLVEAGKRLGGWIRSVKDPATGIMFDKGPRTLRVKGEPAVNTLNLIEELRIEDKLVPITLDHPSASRRMIYVNNKLHILPSNIASLFKKMPPFSKPIFTSIFKDLTSPAKKLQDDNIYDFVERRFGKEISDYLISAMICGICAGDAKSISVKFLMPQLFDMEQKNGSVVVGLVKNMLGPKGQPGSVQGALNHKAVKDRWSIFGFKEGMEFFPKALSEKIILQGADIRMGTEVTKLEIERNLVKCHIASGILESDHVVSCLPANKLATLLKENHPVLSKELASIPYVDVAVVNLAYKGKRLKDEAFGFLIPPSQNNPVLGVIFDSCNFDVEGWTVLTVMMGGAWFDKYFGPNVTTEQLLELAVSKTNEILQIDGQPSAFDVSIMNDCIPQYVVGHNDRIDRIKSYINDKKLPLSLVGSFHSGVGVNDVMLLAKKVSESLLTKGTREV